MSSITVAVSAADPLTPAAIYVAQELGYFKEVGIDKVDVITSQDAFVTALVSGSAQFSQGGTVQWLNAANKSDEGIRLVAGFRDAEQHIIGTKAGITSADQLVGATVTAGPRDGSDEFILRRGLTELGVDPSDVTFVPMAGGGDARFRALLAGQVDAATIYGRHIQPLKDAGGNIVKDALMPRPQQFTVVTDEFLTSNHATVVAYLTATLKAQQFIHADPDGNKGKVFDIVKKFGIEVPDFFVGGWSASLEEVSEDGGFDPAGMQPLVDDTVEVGLMSEGIEWKKFVDLSALWEAQEALGLAQRPTEAEFDSAK